MKIDIGLQPKFLIVCVASLLLLSSVNMLAQPETALSKTNRDAVPDAPQPQLTTGSPNEKTSTMDDSASVSGTVVDESGAAIHRAEITLTDRDRHQLQAVISGVNGEFQFVGLPAGTYLVTVSAKGFAPHASAEFSLTSQQLYELPALALSIAAVSSEVTVRPLDVIAAEQMRAEEKQRLIGIFPNFYVSYIYDAAPLNTKQKFSLASRDTFDWTSFLEISIVAGVQQANDIYGGYGQGAAGYAKRWAAQFVNGRSEDFLSHAVFPALFHQDPRYFYQGSGSTRSRFDHAASYAFVARSDTGHRMPNYSYFLGAMCSGALSNAYYPSADRGINLVFANAAIGLGGRVITTLLQEFLGKGLTHNVPGNGKP